MRWSVTSCSRWRLYVIVDRSAIGDRQPADVAAAAIRGGADAIQLRDKTGEGQWLLAETKRLRPLTRSARIPLIVNDRADVAQAADADGVHLGQEDLPVKEARAILGPGRLIGRSTHSADQAMRAQAEAADYIGLGPIFPTPTKPDYGSVGIGLIAEIARLVRIPIVCIGGIDRDTLERVVGAGAECVAVVRAVCVSHDPEAAARELKSAMVQYGRAAAHRSL